MGFSCGIVGLPNVGKSTLFNALPRSQVPASNYPFCTIDPNVGVVPVPDSRLETLTKIQPTEKVVPTVMRFVDIAGLVKGASEGEGLGNQFLGHIAEVDAIAHIVRCFDDPEVIHVSGSVNPKQDIEIIETELALRDVNVVTTGISRLEKVARSGDKVAAATMEVLKLLLVSLNQGRPAREALRQISQAQLEIVRPLNLLTAKPVLYVANVGEGDLGKEGLPAVKVVQEIAAKEGNKMVVISASLESQIAALESEEERKEFLAAMGLAEPGLNRFIRAGYELLGLITFFTVGPKENRAWTISKGMTAAQAAGKIHSDMQRGFIRAEVIGFQDFVSAGSETKAKDQGKLRLEGKEYQVQDGDLMHFRFSV